MKPYRFSLFLIISLLFVQTLSLTHAVAHPFHAADFETENHTHVHATLEHFQADQTHDLTGIDDWVCELFDSVPNPAIESGTNLVLLITATSAPGLVVTFAILLPSTFYPSHWGRAPPTA
ncbi:hypothetical protein [Thiomicrospira pelophila]|uniref:hypothetical protein n=1 Tax=Thiomicrospira pelophila TaxID=934 RepID=UPI0004A700A1|nr:hypothetical protein [Thiomicrospira pelophila]